VIFWQRALDAHTSKLYGKQLDIIRIKQKYVLQRGCGAPRNSVSERRERMKGGTVSEERSSEKFAMLQSG